MAYGRDAENVTRSHIGLQWLKVQPLYDCNDCNILHYHAKDEYAVEKRRQRIRETLNMLRKQWLKKVQPESNSRPL